MTFYDWLFEYTGNCDVAIREAYKQGQLLLWVCYQNWVPIFLIGAVIVIGFIWLLLSYLFQENLEEEKPNEEIHLIIDKDKRRITKTKLKVRVD